MVEYTITWGTIPIDVNFFTLDYRRVNPDGTFGPRVLIDSNIPPTQTSYTVRLPRGKYEFRLQGNVGQPEMNQTVIITEQVIGESIEVSLEEILSCCEL